ncbi:MAG: PD-(D/E)XK nuclease family protein [Chloroherpetonaceae bacterium]|nr:exodeoxyribonuclease V subunit gamma [Chthonomonadaceae bacterium]MDW8208148.1 PD-(D/E)XK nuclease family protein [Chloroherpetonaceae bacterium]
MIRAASEGRPPLTLVLGPARSGKTRLVADRFLEAFDHALFVTLSPQSARVLTERFHALSHRTLEEIQARIQPFRDLARWVHSPDARVINATLQQLILAELVPRYIRAGDYLGSMRQAPGFVTALAERIREWKLCGITPDLLEAGGHVAFREPSSKSSLRKTAELARLFRAYEHFLRAHRLCDPEDTLLQATAHLRSTRTALPGTTTLIIVDGFYWFNRAQRDLLAAMAQCEPPCQIVVTLPYEPQRSVLFGAPERAYQAFHEEFQVSEVVLPARTDNRPGPLIRLERYLFMPPRTSAEPPPHAQSRTSSGPECDHIVQIFDAPNLYAEVEMVARAFLQRYRTGGYRWDDFGIILRTPADYASILSAVFERYAIPLHTDSPENLTDSARIRTIVHLLDILRYDWRRQDVLRFLKSRYTGLSRIDVDQLRRMAMQRSVQSGREAWLALISRGPGIPEHVADMLRRIAAWEARLTDGVVPFGTRARVLRACLQDLKLDPSLTDRQDLQAERDCLAWETAMEALDAVTEMATLAEQQSLAFPEFYAQVLQVWSHASFTSAPEAEAVRITEPYRAQERPLRVAAVMGLTERVFPRRIIEDPFLRDDERRALRDTLGLELELQRHRADDERFLFYLAVTAPTEYLILSFSRTTHEADALPSFYLDDVRHALPGVVIRTRTLADVAPHPEEAVLPGDQLLAACADLFAPEPEQDPAQRQQREQRAVALMNACLQADPAAERRIPLLLATRNLPPAPRLCAPDLRDDFARRRETLSVSELETYQHCPFQYLLQHVLMLRPEASGAGPRVQGELLHTVLRRYFRQRARKQAPLPAPRTLHAALCNLLEDTLEQINPDITSHQRQMLLRQMKTALKGFADREVRLSAQHTMLPAHCDLAFGLQHAGNVSVDDAERNLLWTEHDPASSPDPLWLQDPEEGERVAVCGIIDRVDLAADSTRALVIDYKLGKAPDFASILSGRSLQVPLYLMAVEQLLGLTAVAACYDSLQETTRKRLYRTEHAHSRQFAPQPEYENGQTVRPLNREEYENLKQTTRQSVLQVARAIASGRVEPTPGAHCRFCEYSDVCRTSVAHGHDGEPLDVAPGYMENLLQEQTGSAGETVESG